MPLQSPDKKMATTKITEKNKIEPTNTPGKSLEYRKLEGLFLYYKKLNPEKAAEKEREFKIKLEAIDLGVKWHPSMKDLGVKGYLANVSRGGAPKGVVDKAEIKELEKAAKPKVEKPKAKNNQKKGK